MGDERRERLTAGDTLRLFVGAFVSELARSGVRHVCLAPGSRSTPLAMLLLQEPGIRVWTHLDERSAAYFGLGMAKMLREPVALLCTSGTAAVNFAPAVVEAFYARVPLLVLTADRPPELRDAGANQTIDQLRLYGSHVKWSVEMPLPESSEQALRYARTIADRAGATARDGPAGPVHINFPFREPLMPSIAVPPGGGDDDGVFAVPPTGGDADGTTSSPENRSRGDDTDAPYVSIAQLPRRPEAAELLPLTKELAGVERGLVICGPQDDPQFPAAVASLAAALGYPILADPLSQVRCGPHYSDLVIDSYDAFLRDDATASALSPQVILRFGATPVSKPLLLYMQRHADRRQILIGDGWNDPALVASDAIQADPRSTCDALLSALRTSDRQSPSSDWAARWRRFDQLSRTALLQRIEDEGAPSEPGAVADVLDVLPDGATLFAGNSMPVRDLDMCLKGSKQRIRTLANRGVSGIDGVMSTALGVSAVADAPLVLVIGDISFYHDMNGLLAAKRHGLSATVVLLNNDGGGIFSFLPQAEESEDFEELFGTPHGLDFRPAAELYGLPYRLAESRAELRSAVEESLAADGVQLIEVRTDRRENVRLHREIWAAAAKAVRAQEAPA
ncbi:MAG: 2-succinyl-5-enolpyruvyl-6-hydroxy-3-cyclohexene-1-carboxylic-acid synthase [Chloroflexi bacterium]|nr:2-succinyl-5-enolpyruvyl-6-hydroxy-3-cyclohexene-1-carboxylic-acid synthase [Chloroflexota bacterium]